jgi:serine/threonine-protein phosphatase PGAM5
MKACALLIMFGSLWFAPVPALAQDTDTSVRTIYLVRHGNYDHDDPRDAEVGKALTALGIAQARLVGDRLRSLPVEMTSFVSSSMTRARETAEVISEDFPALTIEVRRTLRECTPATWREDVMAGLEPGEADACEAQLDSVFAAMFVPATDGDRHEIVVAHGNVTRYLVTRALNVDPMSWLGMSVAHCSITTFRISANGRIKVLSVGDIGHIPPNLQSGQYVEAGPLIVP